ncbi:hypothetical protein GQ55_5G139100 [Panicum hallii var. hallii]|uniref:Uncharacterized protein n=1 Tax=Panicum hallii var. hallii TaxID=1504633 RepID=A0A2T7DG12_9POAL|nr:hypothetical protein GQ55_5G139100 [Panicum hallii var. hallii]
MSELNIRTRGSTQRASVTVVSCWEPSAERRLDPATTISTHANDSTKSFVYPSPNIIHRNRRHFSTGAPDHSTYYADPRRRRTESPTTAPRLSAEAGSRRCPGAAPAASDATALGAAAASPRFRLWLLPRAGGIDRNTCYIQRGEPAGNERGGTQVVGARHLSAESSPNTTTSLAELASRKPFWPLLPTRPPAILLRQPQIGISRGCFILQPSYFNVSHL